MTAPPIGQQIAERNRTKLCARIKHSVLIFTRISVNKNNSFHNSEGKKKSIRININKTTVYVCIKQSMLMFSSKTVNKNNSFYNSVEQKVKKLNNIQQTLVKL